MFFWFSTLYVFSFEHIQCPSGVLKLFSVSSGWLLVGLLWFFISWCNTRLERLKWAVGLSGKCINSIPFGSLRFWWTTIIKVKSRFFAYSTIYKSKKITDLWEILYPCKCISQNLHLFLTTIVQAMHDITNRRKDTHIRQHKNASMRTDCHKCTHVQSFLLNI